VSKSSNQQIATGGNHYVYDEAGHVIGEYDWKGQPIEETVYLGDLPVAVLTPTVTGTAPNTVTTVKVQYVYADHLNAPRVIVRASDNKMVWRWDDSDPFGVQRPDNNPSGLGTFVYNLRFPGQVFDQETLLHYNYYRDYDPATGRYVESDPIGLKGGSNTYLYGNANPVNNTDPTGENAATPIIIGLIIYGSYEMYKSYDSLQQCKKACKEKTKKQCEDGDTSGYHQCESQCLLDSFGGFGSKGPKGPGPKNPYP
jgi:RHS repeat-associated protein